MGEAGPGPGAVPERCRPPPGWLPALRLARRSSKAVTRHWKAMHLQRQKLMALTEYLPPRPPVPERCLRPPQQPQHEVTGGHRGHRAAVQRLPCVWALGQARPCRGLGLGPQQVPPRCTAAPRFTGPGCRVGAAPSPRPSPLPRSPQDNGYARLLRRQVEEVFRDSRMVAVCQYNSMPGEDVVLMRHYLRKHNIEVKFVLNEVGLGAEAGGGRCPQCRPRAAS